jgi:hypothetical protein
LNELDNGIIIVQKNDDDSHKIRYSNAIFNLLFNQDLTDQILVAAKNTSPRDKKFYLSDNKAFSLQEIIENSQEHSGTSKFTVKHKNDAHSLVSFKIKDFFYDECNCQMLIMNDLTHTIAIDKL